MPLKGGGGGSYMPSQTGNTYRKDYEGEGTPDDPFKFYFARFFPNFNAASTYVQLAEGLAEGVAMRIRKIRLHFDGTDGSALAITARVLATTYASGGATTIGYAITDSRLFAAQLSGYHDEAVFDFGPDGVLLMLGTNGAVGSSTGTFNGGWNGYLSVQCAGYAATDDFGITVEGDWWYL